MRAISTDQQIEEDSKKGNYEKFCYQKPLQFKARLMECECWQTSYQVIQVQWKKALEYGTNSNI